MFYFICDCISQYILLNTLLTFLCRYVSLYLYINRHIYTRTYAHTHTGACILIYTPIYTNTCSDILKRKRSNIVIRRKSRETIILPNKNNTIQILNSLNNNTKGKVPSRSNSSTKQSKEESLKLLLKQLKQEKQHPVPINQYRIWQ